MASEGLGLTILPSFLVEDQLSAGKLVMILKNTELTPFILSVVYPSRRHVSARVKALVDYLIDELNE